jgi:phage terminase large subunit-like protein
MVTTTPRPTRLLKSLVADLTVAVTRGTTDENRANLAGAFLQQIISAFK